MSNISTTKAAELARLEFRLGYDFTDKSLLDQALTHKSHSRPHNERLEFLGDAILGYVIAWRLYTDHPDLAEDSLTIIRADLVRRDTLSELAVELEIGEHLRLGTGERKSGGRQRKSILADTLEAIIGAVSLDGGVSEAERVVQTLYQRLLDQLKDHPAPVVKDAKTQLQELLQARSMSLPEYEVVATSGSEHRRVFTVACHVAALSLSTTGRGSSRRAAEKKAAEIMVERVTLGNSSD